MLFVFHFVFLFFHFIYTATSAEIYGPHPKIISQNGNLMIYAADHKNISLKTTNRGYININNENIVLLMKDARSASEKVKRLTSNVINPFTSTINHISDLIEGPDGLLRRVSILENNGTVVPIIPNRYGAVNRNFPGVMRRVRMLEIKMSRLLALLSNNECVSNPCKNGGECQDLFNGYVCRCTEAWTGATCENDVNECQKFTGTALGCQNEATCVNRPGSYECICAVGWFGIHCNRRTQDCNTGSPLELCGHGTCVSQNTGIGYTCICDQGWKTDGKSAACTVDINECESSKPHCSVNPLVPCINVPGTYYCGSCPAGYSGNGYYCFDIDECIDNNGGCSLTPKVQCINTMGSRICGQCPTGYIGDGITCNYRGVCQINNGGCHPLARCVENLNIGDNFVQCLCPDGFTGIGIGPSGCIRSALTPYSGACSSNPCIQGTCSSVTNDSYICTCHSGYSGRQCNISPNSCVSQPCLNGGTCSQTSSGYSCICTTTYTGKNCEQERQSCGGKLNNPTGNLQYPPSNSINYEHSLSCAWVIETEENKILNVTFTSFHLESSIDCLYDWLQIHDGPNSASQIIGRYCGKELPKDGSFISSQNSLYFWFRSDHTITRPGFALKWNTEEPVCGNTIKIQSHGIIKSPGFPGNYPPNRHCLWSLQAPLGKRIQIHFFSLKIGNNPNCSYDFLEIYSSISISEPPLAKYCNSSNPEAILTPGSTAIIVFHSDDKESDSGFELSYTLTEGIPGCGGTFTSERGEIFSPSHEDQYPSNLNCEYKIKLQGNLKIKVVFISFSLEESMNCKFDYFSIHEGGNGNAPLVGRYCGYEIPPSYTSLSNELFLKFRTDTFINDNGFRIKYESVCGDIFDKPSGVISSPPYLKSGKCIYEIKRTPGTAIKLSFSEFEVGPKSDCTFDYLEIRDGDHENSTLIGRYCGVKGPSEIISTHNFLWLKYEIESNIGRKGFKANYSTIDLECGGIYKNSLGLINSPKSLNLYPPNKKCTWVISAPAGTAIQLTWINFQMEYSNGCTADYVELYENYTSSGNSSLIGKYCGNTLPPTTTSISNLVTVNFVSDISLSYDGFALSYYFMNNSITCGGNYFVTTGVITSPNYPSNYPPNKICTWVITVPHGQQIMLNIEDFQVEKYNSECTADSLEIRNGAYESSPLLGIFCGNIIPPQIPSHSNNIFIRFKSDSALNLKGFKIFWDGTARGCGGTITAPSGQLSSPNYPQPYGNNAMCVWKVATSAGSLIQIVFLDLELERQQNCRLDYIEIFDGFDYGSKSIGRFCTENYHPTLLTNSNKAKIKFRSDVSKQYRGFLIKFLTVCNNTLTGYGGVIESLNFPNIYPKNQDCYWRIKVPEGNKINISFSHFDLEPKSLQQKTCKFDYLDITDVDIFGNRIKLLDKTCGSDLPNTLNSTNNNVEIHFVSDVLLHKTGFRLEWVVDGCIALLTRPEGEIFTPKYPKGYPLNTICEWKIQVDYDSSIEIHVKNFNFEDTNDCSYDSLEIFNGPDENAPSLTKVCHADANGFKITSSSNIMFVKFISDASYAGLGFKATYKSVPSQCGGKFTTPRGSISTRNYPNNYKSKDSCEWLIEIKDSFIIELNIIDFDIFFTANCTNNFLKIYDGNSTEAPLLQTLCGSETPNNTLRSTSNKMLLLFESKLRPSKGFLANYSTVIFKYSGTLTYELNSFQTAACGMHVVTGTRGFIDMSDWGAYDCNWTIIADSPEKHVSLTITFMDISEDCENPTLKIFDGENNEAPSIGNYCGRKTPPMIISKGSAMHIELNYAYGIFQATYSVIETDCGGELNSVEGTFASVGYPNNYPRNMECQWTISLAPGNKLQLSFLTFDIIQSENCNADYVEIREKNAHGKLIGVYCGNEVPSNITQVNSVWVQFKSTDIGTAKGFLAEYSLVHGNELFGAKGQVASPLYPKNFQSSNFGLTEPVTWRITVEFHNVILITFKEFNANYYYVENECFSIGLEVYDGYDETSPLLASLCSITLPEPIKTSSNVVFLKYIVQTYRYNLKFLLEWEQIKTMRDINQIGKLQTANCGSDSIIEIPAFGNYNLTSPGYPEGYAGKLNCEWIFYTPPGNHLVIQFSEVDLEAISPQCYNLDLVKVFSKDSDQDTWKLLKSVCLNNHTTSIKAGNYMQVVFKTDAYINKTGFASNIKTECGGQIEDSNGIIEIGNRTKNDWRSRIICEWVIIVKAGRTIQINFLEFDIANDQGICTNNVLFKNGRSSFSPNLGNSTYCGQNFPVLNQTTGNSLFIKYESSSSSDKLKIAFKEVSMSCGGHIKLTESYNSVNISSPNYPNAPAANTECVWIISAPAGESLRMDFIERFDITNSFNCKMAGVEVHDGGTIISNLLNLECNEIPSSIKSTDNHIYIRYFTKALYPKNGFKATISIASCGGTVRGKTGQITSPNFGNLHSFPENTICTWQIIGPMDHYLILTFNEFRLNYKRNCSLTNHLIIKENILPDNESIIGTYCGFKIPSEIQTSSHIVTVQLVVKNSMSFKGFSLSYNTSQTTCGGVLESEFGIITSPNYPVTSHHRRNCEWDITVPTGKRVTIEILDFDLSKSGLSFSQGLAFYNAKGYRSYIKYMYGEDTTKIIKSSGNQIMVYFWSHGSSSHRGFKLKYSSNEPTICPGDFTKDSGEIEAPTANVTSYFCKYVRTTDVNTTLAMIINSALIGSNETTFCRHASSNIQITTEREQTYIAQLCGVLKTPVIIRNPYPTTNLMITKSQLHPKMNYTISYKVNPCGGLHFNSFGIITSPKISKTYEGPLDCAWVIRLEEGQTIKLNFSSFNLTSSCLDYVEIYNGELSSSPKIAQFCGNKLPSFIQSQSNILWIDLHINKIEDGKGFNLTYESVSSGCGGIFHDKTRKIKSPNYPVSYPNNAECLWEIRASEGYHIGLVFNGRFHLEESKNCTNDFVEIWDYKDENWISLGKSCGRKTPNSFNSTSNKMRVLFRTNLNLTGSGFQAEWNLNCGGTFLATTAVKYLTSPGYPEKYSESLSCKYVINSPQRYINIVFEDFEIEKGSLSKDCTYDSVTITKQRYFQTYVPINMIRTPNIVAGVFCGTKTPPPIRWLGTLTVTLKTDAWVNRKGFKLKYFLDSCGGNITQEDELSSPTDVFGNQKYYGSMNCIWNITAPKDKRVILKFTFFEFEYNQNCRYDSLSIYNGPVILNREKLAVLCGNISNHLPIIQSTGNNMLVVMKTDASNNLKGFKAAVIFMYTEAVGCGGTVNLTQKNPSKIIRSPDLYNTGSYAPYLDCHWLITTSLEETIKIEFESFHLSKCKNKNITQCNCDFVEIRDGGGSIAELILKICGHDLPSQIVSSGNHLWIRMVSDGLTESSGFKATITRIPSICGPSLLIASDTKQLIKSPNYPNNYPNNIRCSWVIRTNESYSTIEIHFDDFEIQDATPDDQCSRDKLMIIDNSNSVLNNQGLGEKFIFSGKKSKTYLGIKTSISSYVYCGSGIPATFISTVNEVLVTFVSDGSVNKKGFQLDYRITGCTRNYTTAQGRIVFQKISKNCTTKITAPENYTISIYFQQFLITDYRQCTVAGLKIFDGPPQNGTVLANLCGFQLPNPIFSQTNEVWLQVTQLNRRYGIYDVMYTTTNQGRGCGGQLVYYNGRFTSPMYPQNYRNNSVCRWDITVPRGYLATLKFRTFDLSPANTCTTDFVQLIDIDAMTKEENVRNSYCAGDNPALFVASSNRMALVYTVSVNNGGTGWVAIFDSKEPTPT